VADRGAKLYSEWHWGSPHHEVVSHRDTLVDPFIRNREKMLIDTGRLVELHFREPHKRKDTIFRLKDKEANASHLAFDPDHPYHRLYIFMHPEAKTRMKRKYLSNPEFEHGSRYASLPLAKAAKMAGGRHATGDYPDIEVVPLGILTNVVYAVEKKGDGYSHYIHELGEESGVRPALVLQKNGRPWIAGGNYTAPTPGITD
jgi:hypothetical protein